jgi:N-acetylglucosaminyldiphosphoundecaprenol N-acetyl-beta-D-mannosaminyltransferase
MMKQGTISGYTIYRDTLTGMDQKCPCLINTLNQYSFCLAEKDPDFRKALQHSDILLPDGMAIVWAVRLLTGQKIRKIAGADLHLHLLKELNNSKGSCFYLGSSAQTLDKIGIRMKKEYPNIRVQSYSPPYKAEFTPEDDARMLEAVNAFKPDVLFVGMTAPKQEKWAYKHRDALQTQQICSIGAVFDFYAGTLSRPHPFWVSLRLEWFIRLLKEPARMWKRYLYYGPVFIFRILNLKFRSGNS